ncbi:MAG: aspartyl protease family protein [Pyrinomonadaceae bacterium]
MLKGARDIYLSAVYPGVHYALQRRGAANTALPRPIRFGDVGGRGFMVRTWVNGSGPYDFAVDTGAGATIISRRVAAEARVALDGGAINISGLSGRSAASGRKAFVRALSAGDPDNTLPAKGLFIVADGLPHGVDGVLDPTEVFWPLGYVIDIPDGRISAFDPRTNPLRRSEAPANGAVVPWLMDGTSRRPFVLLDGGRRALLDTGSGFGLAVTENSAAAIGIAVDQGRMREGAHDLGGGRIEARRIRPATVHVGSLALRGVPTDLLLGANPNSPVLLGRDALRPFQITFDPVNRLIKLQAP